MRKNNNNTSPLPLLPLTSQVKQLLEGGYNFKQSLKLTGTSFIIYIMYTFSHLHLATTPNNINVMEAGKATYSLIHAFKEANCMGPEYMSGF